MATQHDLAAGRDDVVADRTVDRDVSAREDRRLGDGRADAYGAPGRDEIGRHVLRDVDVRSGEVHVLPVRMGAPPRLRLRATERRCEEEGGDSERCPLRSRHAREG